MSALLSVVVVIASVYFAEAVLPEFMNDTRRIPEIKQGEKCIEGRVYRMDCNTCHCGPRSALICSKMACLNPKLLKNMNTRNLKLNVVGKKKGCEPGKMYKMKCRKCFCTEKMGLKCSLEGECGKVDRTYTNPENIHSYSPAEFYKLPSLPHQGSECKPGVTYRIDCNTCLCLANGNLMCQKLLCPSYNDVYRLRNQDLSGTPCKLNESKYDECIQCQCVNSKYVCETNPTCKHSDGRRMLHGEFPSDHDRNFIDLDKKTIECKPGMVYKVHCNKCYCQEDASLRCTQKTCLNFEEVQRLKKLRLKLDLEERKEAKQKLKA